MLSRILALLILASALSPMVRAGDDALPALPPLPGENNAVAPGGVSAAEAVDLSQGLPKSEGDRKEMENKKKEELKAAKEEAKRVEAEAKAKEKANKAKAKELAQLNKERKKQGLPPVESVAEGTEGVIAKDTTQVDKKVAKEKAKQLEKLNKERKKQKLEPLTELPGESPSAFPALPALPGAPAAAAPAEDAVKPESAPTEKPKGKKVATKKWTQPDFGPNVMFGGNLSAKGKNNDERIAWASQEVLNTLDFNGFQFEKENGVYAGENKGRQWREFSFKSRKAKGAYPVTVFVEPIQGNKVFLRVGPSEPPAGIPAKDVRAIRAQNQKVLALLQKKLKGRYTRIRKNWETPYQRTAN